MHPELIDKTDKTIFADYDWSPVVDLHFRTNRSGQHPLLPPYLEVIRRIGQPYHHHKFWGIKARSDKGHFLFYTDLNRTPGLRNTHHEFLSLDNQPFMLLIRQNSQDITPYQPLRLLLVPAPEKTLAFLKARDRLAQLPRLRLPCFPQWAIALQQSKAARKESSIFL
ncbi:hypothetical protein BN8_05187 [Fibrisoma limi BUZ 3]|uniref:Uncharacterized protein n=1 Tax=Fibrisoma limi BUZ 3 TaxID=1185876 RepID=I2GPR2_9BACT|nr:hypothetical protein [Fibrisoma limi]CCH55890.1 hypothetical protein BN8_05187 [Fibrisoma limi BUZ 3]